MEETSRGRGSGVTEMLARYLYLQSLVLPARDDNQMSVAAKVIVILLCWFLNRIVILQNAGEHIWFLRCILLRSAMAWLTPNIRTFRRVSTWFLIKAWKDR